MPVPQQLVALAVRHQILLEGLKTQEVRKFLQGMKGYDNLITDTLAQWHVMSLNDLSANQLDSLLKQLTIAQGELFSTSVDKLLNNMPGVSAYEAEHAAKTVRSAARNPGGVDMQLPTASELNTEALKRPIQATGELLQPFVQKWQDNAVARTNNTIRTAWAQGQTVPEVVRALLGTAKLNYQDGDAAVTRAQATTVVRTAVQHVANTARAVTWEENSDLVIGYQWVSTLDSRTSQQCTALDGQHFKLNMGPMPPIHPNCRSTTAPDLPKEFDFLDKDATRSSTDGYVDADTQYFDFLQNQTPAFQDKVLGNTLGEVFRNGGLTNEKFRAMQLDKNFQPLTLNDMRALEPEAFARAGVSVPVSKPEPEATPTPPAPAPVPDVVPPAPVPTPPPPQPADNPQSKDNLLANEPKAPPLPAPAPPAERVQPQYTNEEAINRLNQVQYLEDSPFSNLIEDMDLEGTIGPEAASQALLNSLHFLQERTTAFEATEDVAAAPQKYPQYSKGVQTVTLDQLVTSQPYVERNYVQKYIESGKLDVSTNPSRPAELPIVVKKDGVYYLHDGNHRANAALMLGIKDLSVRLYDMDAK